MFIYVLEKSVNKSKFGNNKTSEEQPKMLFQFEVPSYE